MIDLNSYQKRLKVWQDTNFGPMPPQLIALGISEEVGEVHHAILKNAQNIRKMSREKMIEDVKDGVADMIVYALQLYTSYGIDAEEALSEVFEYVLKRNWKQNPDSGDVIQEDHIDHSETEDVHGQILEFNDDFNETKSVFER